MPSLIVDHDTRMRNRIEAVNDFVAVDGSYGGHFGVVKGTTRHMVEVKLDRRLRRPWGKQTKNKVVRIMKRNVRLPTQEETAENRRILGAVEEGDNLGDDGDADDDAELQLMARLVALQISGDSARHSLFLNELGRALGDP
jgi:hypothetical protein